VIRRLLATVGLAVALTGCATSPAVAPPAPATVAAAPSSTAAPTGTPARPTHFRYAAIGAEGNLEPSGLNPDGTAEVAPVTEPMQATYLAWSRELAPTRPLTLYGHVNGTDGVGGPPAPGVFAKLSTSTVGDLVMVDFDDGASRTYRVIDKQQVDKDAFPTSIYDPVTAPTLRLVTCGGAYDSAARSYEDNIVVSAVAT
jgi:Sortase domain